MLMYNSLGELRLTLLHPVTTFSQNTSDPWCILFNKNLPVLSHLSRNYCITGNYSRESSSAIHKVHNYTRMLV